MRRALPLDAGDPQRGGDANLFDLPRLGELALQIPVREPAERMRRVMSLRLLLDLPAI